MSPHKLHRTGLLTFLFTVGAVLLTRPIPCRASLVTVDERMPSTDNLVLGCAHSGDTVYVSGYFQSIGPASGSGVPLDRRVGDPTSRYPKVAGSVAVVISDHTGGWFIGGNFAGVGGEPHRNLAHVLANGRVATWAPDPNAPVATLSLAGKTLYVGGSFTTIGGQLRTSAAAIDIRTGTATPWNPSADAGVTAILATPSTVFVGGWFSTIGGKPRTYVAALDPVSGKANEWRADADGAVTAFAVANDILFLGGQFANVGGVHRVGLAAVDIPTATVKGWSADVENRFRERDPFIRVEQLSIWDNHLIVAGRFTHIGGAPRAGVAELDLGTGSVGAWNPNPVTIPHSNFAPWTKAAVVFGRTVYLAGGFTTLGGTTRPWCGAVDAVTGIATDWAPRVSGGVTCLAVDGSQVYAGGSFNFVGQDWKERYGLAAFDERTGAVLDWNPHPDVLGSRVAVGAGSVFVAGDFSHIAGQARDGVAVFDATTGALRPWAPSFGQYSRTLLADDQRVVICRDKLVSAYDASNGKSLWSITTNDVTWALALDGRTLYVGGWFSQIAGQPRSSGATLDVSTGALLDWNPHQPDVILQLAPGGGRVFASGWFLPDGQVAAFDAASGEYRWRAYANSNTFGIAATPSHVFVGGVFDLMNGEYRNGLAALDPASGAVTAWDLHLGGSAICWGLWVVGDRLYVGGNFQGAGVSPVTNFAVVPLTRTSSLSVRRATAASIDAPALRLEPVAPNPVREHAAIAFTLPSPGEVSVGVFDLQGRRVAAPIDHAFRAAGTWSVDVVTNGWAPGCYLCRLEFGGRMLVGKMFVLR